MKKLVALMLTLLIGTCAIMFTGCGSAFDGNYKEVEKGEVKTFSDEVSKTENNEGVSIDYSKGFSLSTNYEMKTSSLTSTAKVEAKAIAVDGKLEMSGKVETSTNGELMGVKADVKLNGEVYYKDGYAYTNISTSGISAKIKAKSSVDEVLGKYMGSIDEGTYCSLPQLLVEYGDKTGVKFYMDKTDAQCKIKIVVPEMEEDDPELKELGLGKVAVKGEFYLVYDAQNKLTAVKASAEMYSKENKANYIKVNFVAEPFGGKISFPNDLDSYSVGSLFPKSDNA